MAGKIFVNYRRDDERAVAARVRDRLAGAFGATSVFMDVDNLLAGQRFDKELEKAIGQTDVLLAVIGPRWMELLSQRQTTGERDYVREEIAAALKRGVVVIPVLIERTPLPRGGDLPEDIREMVLYQKHDISHESFGRDIEGLTTAIKASRRTGKDQTRAGSIVGVPWALLATGATGALAAGYIAAGSFGIAMPWPWSPAAVGIPSAKSPTTTTGPATTGQGELARETKVKGDDAERSRLAALSNKKAPRDPALSIKPGGGQSFRDFGCPGVPCPEMIVAPAGEFLMGSTLSEIESVYSELPKLQGDWFKREDPQHRVTIVKPFAAGRTHITRAEFAAFVAATGYNAESSACATYDGRKWTGEAGNSWRSPGFDQTDGHPVVCIKFSDATAYTEWLSKVTNKTYRLLSEAELEYLARSTSSASPQSLYFFGSDKKQLCTHGNGADETSGKSVKVPRASSLVAPCQDGYVYTSPVASFKATPWGVHDVFGNVLSWTADWWNDTHSGAPSDGTARTSGDGSRRVMRGGAWLSYPQWLRPAFREQSGPLGTDRAYTVGFRIGRTINP